MHTLCDSDAPGRARSELVALLMDRIAAPLAAAADSLRALTGNEGRLDAAERQRLLARSRQGVLSVQTLLERLRYLASIRAGRSCSELRIVNVAEILRRELAGREARPRDKELELELRDHGCDSRVLADPDGVRIIFANLIDNAAKYTSGPAKKVEVDITGDGGYVRVRVRDNGIGIPPEDQSRVFEEFHRAGNVGAARASGSGLGLAFVKELVGRYGGGIDIESAVGVGTSIFVRLPRAASGSARSAPPRHGLPGLQERLSGPDR